MDSQRQKLTNIYAAHIANSSKTYYTHAASLQKAKIINEMVQPCNPSLGKKATIHQLTTMLATSKNVLFPGHNHLLTTSTDDSLLVGAQ